MNRRTKRVLPLLMSGLLLASTGIQAVQAQARSGRDRGPRLDLTQEQRRTIRDLRQESKKKATLRKGEIASLQAQIQVEFMEPEIDARAVRALGRELRKLIGDGVEARLADRVAFLEVLTPEQRRQIQEQRSDRRGRDRHDSRRRGRERFDRRRGGFGIGLDLGIGAGPIGRPFGRGH